MVTNYAHQIAAHEELTGSSDRRRAYGGVGTRIRGRVRQLLCGLHGHDMLLQFGQDRLFLKCVSCGHESPGWELTEAPPRVIARGDARRHRLARPQLVD